MLINKNEKNLVLQILNEVLIEKKRTVQYYENSYLPEIYECTGISQKGHLRRAIENLEDFEMDIKDLKHYINNNITNNIPIEDYLLRTPILSLMKFYYRQCGDFKDNPFIVIGNLKKIVLLKNILVRYDSRFEIYSTKWLCLN